MSPLTPCKTATVLSVLIASLLACFALPPTAYAGMPKGVRSYPNREIGEDEGALVRLPTAPDNPAVGFDAMDSNANASDSAALASWTWRPTASLNTARFLHTATLLPNGMVLVAGGDLRGVLASADLYDPANRIWTPTGSLNVARSSHTATLLPNGMVLVAGGDDGHVFSASAELYDPASGTWTLTGSLNAPRLGHTATLLANGMVLVAGGLDINGGESSTSELYDPATGTWTVTGNLNTARSGHTTTLLANGTVLVAGGISPV